MFNTVGRRIQYEAGDHVSVSTESTNYVTRMLIAMETETDAGCIVPVISSEWKSAVEQHYPKMGHQPVLPIASLLKISTL